MSKAARRVVEVWCDEHNRSVSDTHIRMLDAMAQIKGEAWLEQWLVAIDALVKEES